MSDRRVSEQKLAWPPETGERRVAPPPEAQPTSVTDACILTGGKPEDQRIADRMPPPTATPTPAPPEESQWRCSRCHAILDPQQVTYEEFHDGDCGGKAICKPVTAPQPSAVEMAQLFCMEYVLSDLQAEAVGRMVELLEQVKGKRQ